LPVDSGLNAPELSHTLYHLSSMRDGSYRVLSSGMSQV